MSVQRAAGLRLADLQTPALILDVDRLRANADRLARRLEGHGVPLRPHVKTVKSIDAARIALRCNARGITVATLNEAEYFASHGIEDITYAVCITPNKLGRAADLLRSGIDLRLITDSVSVAQELVSWADDQRLDPGIFVEIDCGEHRTGVEPDSAELLQIARLLHASSHVDLRGVLTHAGQAYDYRLAGDLADVAAVERGAALRSAERLRGAGLPCPEVSVGSTPTAAFGTSFAGVTEVRAGVYLLGDLFQAEIGTCRREDIAVSVLATVVSCDEPQNRLVIDAGSLALSQDSSTASTAHDCGFGVVLDALGQPLGVDAVVHRTHQEHGEVRASGPLPFARLAVGSQLRILPNHACMTAGMYDRYYVVSAGSDAVDDVWTKTLGWEPQTTRARVKPS